MDNNGTDRGRILSMRTQFTSFMLSWLREYGKQLIQSLTNASKVFI